MTEECYRKTALQEQQQICQIDHSDSRTKYVSLSAAAYVLGQAGLLLHQRYFALCAVKVARAH